MKQRYDSYKPSGIDWIGEIPSHWNILPLKYVCKNLDYLRQPISAEERERNNPLYDYYGASGIIDKIDYYNVDDTVLLIGEDGANLVMRNLPLIYKASGKFWVNNHAHILKPKNDSSYSYLAYLLETGDYSLYITGSAQPKLSQENLNKFILCLPPLPEQEAIASWLDEKCSEIDAAIAKVDREIELIDELKQSEISRVVTRGLNPDVPLKQSGIDWIGEVPEHWEIKNGKYLMEILPGYPADSSLFVTEEDGFPLIRIRDIDSYNTEIRYAGFIPEPYIIRKGDVLVGMDGDFNVAIWKGPDGLLNQRVCKICGSEDYIRQYAYYILPKLLKRINDVTYATTVKHLSTYDISNSKLPVPPLTEQQSIADYLDKKCAEIDGLKEKLVRKRETLKELRQSIISEVVTGKRKVI